MIQTPVVITGGKGMLGQDLARAFADLGPVVLDRAELDITDEDAVKAKFRELKPGTVINAAAYNAVDDAETEDGFAIAKRVNADGPRILANACKDHGAVFVHYSTDYVFDGTNKDGYREDDQPNPQSGYARSKRLGEQEVLSSGARAYVARTCKLFGVPGESEKSKESFIDLMLRLSQDRDTLDVVDEELASPTYTPDLAAQTRVMLEGGYEPGMYHITNSGACTWHEFAQELFRLTGKEMALHPVPASAFPRPAARPKYSILRNTKLPPMRSWQEALAAYLRAQGYSSASS